MATGAFARDELVTDPPEPIHRNPRLVLCATRRIRRAPCLSDDRSQPTERQSGTDDPGKGVTAIEDIMVFDKHDLPKFCIVYWE
jgi:hypothetical protein